MLASVAGRGHGGMIVGGSIFVIIIINPTKAITHKESNLKNSTLFKQVLAKFNIFKEKISPHKILPKIIIIL